MGTGVSRLVPGTRLTGEEHKQWVEKYNRMMDDFVAWRKHGWNEERKHADAEGFKKMLEGMEAFMEKKGVTGFPKHSHRFAPENLWPERYGQGESGEGNGLPGAAGIPEATPEAESF
jgi:hypothetical protein